MSWKTGILNLEKNIHSKHQHHDVNELFRGRVIVSDLHKNGKLKSYLKKTGKSKSYLDSIRMHGRQSRDVCSCRECNRTRNYFRRNGKSQRYLDSNTIGNG